MCSVPKPTPPDPVKDPAIVRNTYLDNRNRAARSGVSSLKITRGAPRAPAAAPINTEGSLAVAPTVPVGGQGAFTPKIVRAM